MIFTETKLKGAFVIELERRDDERGFLPAALPREFEQRGMKPLIAQSGIASNRKKGTVRGMHFQLPRPSSYAAPAAPSSTSLNLELTAQIEYEESYAVVVATKPTRGKIEKCSSSRGKSVTTRYSGGTIESPTIAATKSQATIWNKNLMGISVYR